MKGIPANSHRRLPDPGGSHARSVDQRGAGGSDQEDDGAVGERLNGNLGVPPLKSSGVRLSASTPHSVVPPSLAGFPLQSVTRLTLAG